MLFNRNPCWSESDINASKVAITVTLKHLDFVTFAQTNFALNANGAKNIHVFQRLCMTFNLYIAIQCMLSGFPAHMHSIHTNKRMSIKKRSKHKNIKNWNIKNNNHNAVTKVYSTSGTFMCETSTSNCVNIVIMNIYFILWTKLFLNAQWTNIRSLNATKNTHKDNDWALKC